MENRNHTPHGYEWRYHLMPGQPGARWVLCRKMSSARRERITQQAAQRELARARAAANHREAS